jgi:hypothetical protein
MAIISDDLTTRVFASPMDHPLPLDQKAHLSMILIRYPDPKTARQVASRIAADSAHPANPPDVELVIETDRSGHRQVTDPSHGAAAWAKSDVLSWGGFGLVIGAIMGATSGGGILGFLKGGLVTGIAWGLFGLVAGALYGLWAGRAISPQIRQPCWPGLRDQSARTRSRH